MTTLNRIDEHLENLAAWIKLGKSMYNMEEIESLLQATDSLTARLSLVCAWGFSIHQIELAESVQILGEAKRYEAASVLARTMWEGAVNLIWLLLKPHENRIKKWMDYFFVEKYQQMKLFDDGVLTQEQKSKRVQIAYEMLANSQYLLTEEARNSLRRGEEPKGTLTASRIEWGKLRFTDRLREVLDNNADHINRWC